MFHTPIDIQTSLIQNKEFGAPVTKPWFQLQKFSLVRVHLWVPLFVFYFNFVKNISIKHRSVYVQCFVYNLKVSPRRRLPLPAHRYYFARNVWLYLRSLSKFYMHRCNNSVVSDITLKIEEGFRKAAMLLRTI